MGVSRCTNRPVIAGRRLEWTGLVTETILRDEMFNPLYKITRQYGENGRALHDPEKGFGFQYKVVDLATGEDLGTDTYLGCAKGIAEKHFGETHGGQVEGYWSSKKVTRQLATKLRAASQPQSCPAREATKDPLAS